MAAANPGVHPEVLRQAQQVRDERRVNRVVKNLLPDMERGIRRNERRWDERFGLRRVRISNDKFRTGAMEAAVKKARECLERRVPVKVGTKDLEAIRYLLQEGLKVRDTFRLNDEQLLSLIASRTDGNLKAQIGKAMVHNIPVAEVYHEMQIFHQSNAESKVAADRAISDFRDTKQGIRHAGEEVLNRVRAYGQYLPRKSDRKRAIATKFRSKLLELLPLEEAERLEKTLDRDRIRAPRKVLQEMLKREVQIDAILIPGSKRKVGGVMTKEGQDRRPPELDDEENQKRNKERDKWMRERDEDRTRWKKETEEEREKWNKEKERLRGDRFRLEKENVRAEEEKRQINSEVQRLKREETDIDRRRREDNRRPEDKGNDDPRAEVNRMVHRIQTQYPRALANWYKNRCPKCTSRFHMSGAACPYGNLPGSFDECPKCKNGFHLEKHCLEQYRRGEEQQGGGGGGGGLT